MGSQLGKIYCQRCRASNSVADESCTECGTRLMLVFEPTGNRFEDASQVSGTLDEHLLERISLLENNLSRVVDKLERTLDLMLKQAQTSHTSHNLLDALITTLAETGALNRQLFRARWGERGGPASTAPAGSDEVRASIVALYEGPEAEAFARAVGEGLELLAAGKLASGVRALEKAAALDAENGPLDRLVGRALLAAGRPARALTFLKRAAKAAPGDPRPAALLGLALAEAGDAERAESLLSEAAKCGVSTFALHLGLGQLAAGRRDWRSARAQLKLALGRRPCPEALYLLGRAHRRLAQPRAAASCLRRAVELDPGHAASWELLGRVLAERGDEAGAKKASANARRARREGAAAGKGGAKRGGRSKPGAGGSRPRRLVTGGDPALMRVLAEDLLAEDLPR